MNIVYKELYKSDLIVSEAIQMLKSIMRDYNYNGIYAPPDLFNRNRDTGKSTAELFYNAGIDFIKASNDRIQGWLQVKEWLHVYNTRNEQTGEPKKTSKLKIFNNCKNLIRCIPQLQ